MLTWLRPAATQFSIHWGRKGRRYEPDFVVETAERIYLVETKSSRDLNLEEVQRKADAARAYCRACSEYTTRHGGKPWSSLLSRTST